MNTATRKPSFPLHLAFVWCGGIILWPLLTGLFTFAVLPSGEAFTLTMLVFLLNIFCGWAFALVVFVLHWGLRGWIETARQFRDAREDQLQGNEEYAQPVPHEATSEEQMLAEWARVNHIGCCMHHRDSEGYPSHGGPDCRHPEVVG